MQLLPRLCANEKDVAVIASAAAIPSVATSFFSEVFISISPSCTCFRCLAHRAAQPKPGPLARARDKGGVSVDNRASFKRTFRQGRTIGIAAPKSLRRIAADYP